MRATKAGEQPPLARLISRKGRGGAVAVKLYIALLWRCSQEPFNTEISARKWAALLDLPDPNTAGARRVTEAMNVLEKAGLVRLERRRGEPSIITMLKESGDGSPYELPSTAYTLARGEAKRAELYFKVPTALWETGHLQEMSGPALAMLLVLLAESTKDSQGVWWSVSTFPSQYSISPSMRARGTTELVRRGLLYVKKQLLPNSGETGTFTRERVRNIYHLIGAAQLPEHAAAARPKAE